MLSFLAITTYQLTATENVDYEAVLPAPVSVPTASSAQVNVAIINDADEEADEQFTVEISGTAVTNGFLLLHITIIDDDGKFEKRVYI